MTNFEKAQSKLRSLIWWPEYNMYLDKCTVKAYKRHCKKCPMSFIMKNYKLTSPVTDSIEIS